MLHHWYEALNAKVGIAVPAVDVEKTRQALYRAKQQSPSSDIEGLRLVAAKQEVWIIHEEFFDGYKINLNKVRKALSAP